MSAVITAGALGGQYAARFQHARLRIGSWREPASFLLLLAGAAAAWITLGAMGFGEDVLGAFFAAAGPAQRAAATILLVAGFLSEAVVLVGARLAAPQSTGVAAHVGGRET